MLMVAIVVHMLMRMAPGFMAVLMAIMGVFHRLMFMFMLMFVLAVAAHVASPPLI